MPLYLFNNSQTGETREIVFSMNDEKVYNGEDGTEKGVWKRIYVNPEMTIDTNLDPFNPNAFANCGKYGTLGDAWDKSAELSERRAAIMGEDPVKKKMLDRYAAKRNGKRHPEELKQATAKANDEANKALSKLGIKLNLTQPKSRRLK